MLIEHRLHARHCAEHWTDSDGDSRHRLSCWACLSQLETSGAEICIPGGLAVCELGKALPPGRCSLSHTPYPSPQHPACDVDHKMAFSPTHLLCNLQHA